MGLVCKGRNCDLHSARRHSQRLTIFTLAKNDLRCITRRFHVEVGLVMVAYQMLVDFMRPQRFEIRKQTNQVKTAPIHKSATRRLRRPSDASQNALGDPVGLQDAPTRFQPLPNQLGRVSDGQLATDNFQHA